MLFGMKRFVLLFLVPTVIFCLITTPCYAAKSREEVERDKIISKALMLEEQLNQLVIGQEEAVKTTADAIIRYAAGVNDPNNPVGTLLYCGPSGVGKTELAKQLARVLYNDENRFVRFNMAEYSVGETVWRLIGSPAGYQNHQEGGQLTNALKKNPFSVVLFDEIEKAHPRVLKLFLQLFDEGYITSAKNEKLDCRNCIFILTSNVAAAEIASLSQDGLNSHEILFELQPALMEILSPELYNRMDPVVFRPLSGEVMVSIVHKMLAELANRIAGQKKVYLEFDDSIVNYLVQVGFDPLLGARPVKRMIEKELTPLVAKALIRADYKRGDCLLLILDGAEIVLRKK